MVANILHNTLRQPNMKMTKVDIEAQFQSLVDEQERARANYYKAFAPVGQKMGAVGRNESRTNPTLDELARVENAWDVWASVKERMVQLAKAYAQLT